jgi:hypothetical protein
MGKEPPTYLAFFFSLYHDGPMILRSARSMPTIHRRDVTIVTKYAQESNDAAMRE